MIHSYADSVEERFLSTAKDSFSLKSIRADQAKRKHIFSKYKSLRDGPLILSYGDAMPESYATRIAAKQAALSRSMLEHSQGSRFNEQSPSFETESSKILGRRARPEEVAEMRNMLRSSQAPLAMGRSGMRAEKGLSTTGLMGERLMLNCDKSKNSLVQRTWLYTDDPALHYKVHGLPAASIPSNVSLSIGAIDDRHDHLVSPGADYRKKYHITAGPLSRGVPCGQVFLDHQG